MSESKSVFPTWTKNVERHRPPKTWEEPKKCSSCSPVSLYLPRLEGSLILVFLNLLLARENQPPQVSLHGNFTLGWSTDLCKPNSFSNIHSTVTILGFSSTRFHVLTQPTCSEVLSQLVFLARSLRDLKAWHARNFWGSQSLFQPKCASVLQLIKKEKAVLRSLSSQDY